MRTCKRETYAIARACIEQMLPVQQAHTGDPSIPLAPDFELYKQLEDLGKLFALIVRDDDRPIGYAIGIVHQHPNSKGFIIGTIPTYYVEDGPARVFVQKALLQQAATRLAAAGAKRVRIETTPKASNGRMLEKMGYRTIALVYEIDPSEIAEERLQA